MRGQAAAIMACSTALLARSGHRGLKPSCRAAEYGRERDVDSKEPSVPDFRYYCLNGQDRIILGANVIAVDLRAAVQVAYEACRDHPHFASSRIEVWQGPTKLYATDAACPGHLAGPS